MSSHPSHHPSDISPEPDLCPLYPTTAHIAILLSSHSGLHPSQKAKLVAHCLERACSFGELSVIHYLLTDPQAQAFVDLSYHDDDGLGLVSLTIHGFGAESDRDVEREECVRLLVAQGADLSADHDGWTPLHHAALLSPPTLISHLMTHGCSPLAVTRRGLTPLDIVTAHTMLPGREAVALILEEAMITQGWDGGRMKQNRKVTDKRMRRRQKQEELRLKVNKALGIPPQWWGEDGDSSSSDSEVEDMENEDDRLYTPPADYSSMLVFSPATLPQIFDSLISNYRPTLRDATPANSLYMLARFAALTCDHTWLEDLIIGATDAIEEAFFSHPDDLSSLAFWLYNTTVWLHLLQCDNAINEACSMLGSLDLIEEVINSVFVFIIRFAERKIDSLLDAALLDYAPLGSDTNSVQFESEWSIFRPFGGMRKANSPNTNSLRNGAPASPPSPNRPLSPSHSQNTISPSTHKRFSSLRETFSRGHNPTHASVSSIFPDRAFPSPSDLTSFLTALHTFLMLSDINPALISQLWSQVMYWTSCEIFNRVITRKKYLCRSKATQITSNIGFVEEWLDQMDLPPGIKLHFVPVKDLLYWLQNLSSIVDFQGLVETIQKIKDINPLQMRRAVRDYKYEVNERRMDDESIQYLTQLQKDWERHRLKLGVEAVRKEIGERDRERESILNDGSSSSRNSGSTSANIYRDPLPPQQQIDLLFNLGDATWEPIRPPQVLGELLDSRHMLPLLFPSDPRLLAVVPDRSEDSLEEIFSIRKSMDSGSGRSKRQSVRWKSKNRRVRELAISALKYVDIGLPEYRWEKTFNEDGDLVHLSASRREVESDAGTTNTDPHITPFTRRPSLRSKGRASVGDETFQE
ncbi:hypothetical protein AX16_006470 [Volvariella volvacea WC 439]|nr:hypothetical protein AX16_006470 [Volvariella volvacea WC 439]